MAKGWFITGTDTGVGKTRVACGLLTALAQAGQRVVGMKPLATGCQPSPQGLRNEDAQALQACASVSVPYEDVNPYAFLPPTAPHLAAHAAGMTIDLHKIRQHYRRLQDQADYCVVEGVGGWMVPVGPQQMLSDLVKTLDLSVILVVGVRVGALNHALLTQAALVDAGVCLTGWVASRLDPDPLLDDYLPALHGLLSAPCLAEFPYQPQARPAAWAACFNAAFLDNLLAVQT